MNSLEELLQKWEHGELSDSELKQLVDRLSEPEARAQLVRRSVDRAVIAASLCAEESTPQPIGHGSSKWMHWKAVLVAVAASLLVAVGIWAMLSRQSPLRAELVASEGTVTVQRGGLAMRLDGTAPFRLRQGDVLRTGGNGNARVSYVEESTWIEFANDTEAEIYHSKVGKRIVLRVGRFEADVSPQPKGRPMICETPLGKATVLGTRFFLTAEGDRATLEVQEGRVRYQGANVSEVTDVQERHYAESRNSGGVTEGQLGSGGKYEGESLLYRDAQGEVFMRREEGKASGDYQRDFRPRKLGDSVTFLIPVLEAGRYQVIVGASKNDNRGIYQLAIGDESRGPFHDQGPQRDYFSAEGYTYEDFDLGQIIFDSAGDKLFRFTCVGMNPSAHFPSKKLGIDYIQLMRISPP